MAEGFAINPPNAPIGWIGDVQVIMDRTWYSYFAKIQAVAGDGLIVALRDAEYLTYSPSLALPNSRQMLAGAGLDLAITSSEATFSLENTAVTPGSYGSSSSVGQFTVDQQGRLTFSGDVAISPSAIGSLVPADIGVTVQAFDVDLAALATLGGTGHIVRTGAATYAVRTVTGTAAQISVANGDGVAGNPTLALVDTAVSPASYGSATSVPSFTVDQKGRLTAASGNAIPALDGGTYTPTLTNTTNIDASTAHECHYVRVGPTVHVFGRVDIDPTASAASIVLGVSLPIASAFTSEYDLSGTVNGLPSGYTQAAGVVRGDATNDRAQVEFVAQTTANTTYMVSFGYRVI